MRPSASQRSVLDESKVREFSQSSQKSRRLSQAGADEEERETRRRAARQFIDDEADLSQEDGGNGTSADDLEEKPTEEDRKFIAPDSEDIGSVTAGDAVPPNPYLSQPFESESESQQQSGVHRHSRRRRRRERDENNDEGEGGYTSQPRRRISQHTPHTQSLNPSQPRPPAATPRLGRSQSDGPMFLGSGSTAVAIRRSEATARNSRAPYSTYDQTRLAGFEPPASLGDFRVPDFSTGQIHPLSAGEINAMAQRVFKSSDATDAQKLDAFCEFANKLFEDIVPGSECVPSGQAMSRSFIEFAFSSIFERFPLANAQGMPNLDVIIASYREFVGAIEGVFQLVSAKYCAIDAEKVAQICGVVNSVKEFIRSMLHFVSSLTTLSTTAFAAARVPDAFRCLSFPDEPGLSPADFAANLTIFRIKLHFACARAYVRRMGPGNFIIMQRPRVRVYCIQDPDNSEQFLFYQRPNLAPRDLRMSLKALEFCPRTSPIVSAKDPKFLTMKPGECDSKELGDVVKEFVNQEFSTWSASVRTKLGYITSRVTEALTKLDTPGLTDVDNSFGHFPAFEFLNGIYARDPETSYYRFYRRTPDQTDTSVLPETKQVDSFFESIFRELPVIRVLQNAGPLAFFPGCFYPYVNVETVSTAEKGLADRFRFYGGWILDVIESFETRRFFDTGVIKALKQYIEIVRRMGFAASSKDALQDMFRETALSIVGFVFLNCEQLELFFPNTFRCFVKQFANECVPLCGQQPDAPPAPEDIDPESTTTPFFKKVLELVEFYGIDERVRVAGALKLASTAEAVGYVPENGDLFDLEAEQANLKAKVPDSHTDSLGFDRSAFSAERGPFGSCEAIARHFDIMERYEDGSIDVILRTQLDHTSKRIPFQYRPRCRAETEHSVRYMYAVLWRLMQPMSLYVEPLILYLYGVSGSGKTTITDFLFRQLLWFRATQMDCLMEGAFAPTEAQGKDQAKQPLVLTANEYIPPNEHKRNEDRFMGILMNIADPTAQNVRLQEKYATRGTDAAYNVAVTSNYPLPLKNMNPDRKEAMQRRAFPFYFSAPPDSRQDLANETKASIDWLLQKFDTNHGLFQAFSLHFTKKLSAPGNASGRDGLEITRPLADKNLAKKSKRPRWYGGQTSLIFCNQFYTMETMSSPLWLFIGSERVYQSTQTSRFYVDTEILRIMFCLYITTLGKGRYYLFKECSNSAKFIQFLQVQGVQTQKTIPREHKRYPAWLPPSNPVADAACSATRAGVAEQAAVDAADEKRREAELEREIVRAENCVLTSVSELNNDPLNLEKFQSLVSARNRLAELRREVDPDDDTTDDPGSGESRTFVAMDVSITTWLVLANEIFRVVVQRNGYDSRAQKFDEYTLKDVLANFRVYAAGGNFNNSGNGNFNGNNNNNNNGNGGSESGRSSSVTMNQADFSLPLSMQVILRRILRNIVTSSAKGRLFEHIHKTHPYNQYIGTLQQHMTEEQKARFLGTASCSSSDPATSTAAAAAAAAVGAAASGSVPTFDSLGVDYSGSVRLADSLRRFCEAIRAAAEILSNFDPNMPEAEVKACNNTLSCIKTQYFFECGFLIKKGRQGLVDKAKEVIKNLFAVLNARRALSKPNSRALTAFRDHGKALLRDPEIETILDET